MSGTKHTPGPWSVRFPLNYTGRAAIFWPDRSKGGLHERRLDDRGAFDSADARLIAAAPELLTAAKEALSAMESIWETRGREDEWIYDEMGSELSAGYFSLRAAIAKAVGHD